MKLIRILIVIIILGVIIHIVSTQYFIPTDIIFTKENRVVRDSITFGRHKIYQYNYNSLLKSSTTFVGLAKNSDSLSHESYLFASNYLETVKINHDTLTIYLTTLEFNVGKQRLDGITYKVVASELPIYEKRK